MFRGGHAILKSKSKFNISTVWSFPHVVVSATGGGAAIFDDLLSHHNLRRNALVAVSNFTAVPLLARSEMNGVFTKLASEVFEKSFGLTKRRVPLDIGEITTNMVWHVRNEKDKKHAWLRQQIKTVFRDF